MVRATLASMIRTSISLGLIIAKGWSGEVGLEPGELTDAQADAIRKRFSGRPSEELTEEETELRLQAEIQYHRRPANPLLVILMLPVTIVITCVALVVAAVRLIFGKDQH